eukprot:scaffold21812_cov110-Isochrysis_galbana.AAC.21
MESQSGHGCTPAAPAEAPEPAAGRQITKRGEAGSDSSAWRAGRLRLLLYSWNRRWLEEPAAPGPPAGVSSMARRAAKANAKKLTVSPFMSTPSSPANQVVAQLSATDCQGVLVADDAPLRFEPARARTSVRPLPSLNGAQLTHDAPAAAALQLKRGQVLLYPVRGGGGPALHAMLQLTSIPQVALLL